MTMHIIRFGDFTLDPANRQLRRGGEPVELNARYFDALGLLATHSGQLVSKDRFLDEVWRGVPVTDEALTQCIRILRRTLGDDAAMPRFIETVPKHGYRFIAPVDSAGSAVPHRPKHPGSWMATAAIAAAGTIGGGIAGLVGGLVYGIAGVSRAPEAAGGVSVLLVVVCLSILAGTIGGLGVAGGIALGLRGRPGWFMALGGALGGLVVGAGAKLLGLDAFTLLFGRSPGDITGAGEAALLGIATGLSAMLACRRRWTLARSVVVGAALGASAGLVVALTGGTLMAGSLDRLAQGYPGSRITMDRIAGLLGESGFGPITRAVTSATEALLFVACCTAALLLAIRGMGRSR